MSQLYDILTSMSSNKMKYTIYPDRIYVLEYDEFKAEVTGEEILGMLYGAKHLDQFIDELKQDQS